MPRRPLLPGWLFCALFGVWAAYAPALAQGNALMSAPRSLKRSVDTVLIKGEALGPRILGAPKHLLRVFACKGGFMLPITYQIDERTRAGGYCYDRGPTSARVQDEDKGRVDGNDELLVLAREVGDRATPQALKLVPGYAAVQEVELTDPLDQGKAWIYVYRFPQGGVLPPPVTTDLVSLTVQPREEEEEAICTYRGEGFSFNNARTPNNQVRATSATFRQPDGSWSQSPVDCSFMRGVATFMWVEVVRHSSDIRVQLGGWIDGPIRVVAQSQLKVYLALGFWATTPDSYYILWPNKVTMPTNADCPVNLDQGGDSSYTLCWDMAKRTRGWKFYNSHNPDPVDIDGVMSPAEQRLDLTWPDWNCTYGPEGAMISKFVIPSSMRRPTNRLYYLDDQNAGAEAVEEGLQFEVGAFGTNGYRCDLRGMRSGTYPGDYVTWYLPAGYQHGDHVKYLNEYDHPIKSATGTTGEGGS
mgnify:CR=1 FL=1